MAWSVQPTLRREHSSCRGGLSGEYRVFFLPRLNLQDAVAGHLCGEIDPRRARCCVPHDHEAASPRCREPQRRMQGLDCWCGDEAGVLGEAV